MADVIPFPTTARAWTRSDLIALDGARKALQDRWSAEPVRALQGAGDDGAPWACLQVGDEDAPEFSRSFHRADARGVAVLNDAGGTVMVRGSLGDALRDALGVNL
jgi:hypothetical protein